MYIYIYIYNIGMIPPSRRYISPAIHQSPLSPLASEGGIWWPVSSMSCARRAQGESSDVWRKQEENSKNHPVNLEIIIFIVIIIYEKHIPVNGESSKTIIIPSKLSITSIYIYICLLLFLVSYRCLMIL